MKNVTITLDEEVARWARTKAAEEETSVSKLIGEMLREKMLMEKSDEASMQGFLARKPVRLRGLKDRYPSREELHEREQGLCRHERARVSKTLDPCPCPLFSLGHLLSTLSKFTQSIE
jgi:hypothetical protein